MGSEGDKRSPSAGGVDKRRRTYVIRILEGLFSAESTPDLDGERVGEGAVRPEISLCAQRASSPSPRPPRELAILFSLVVCDIIFGKRCKIHSK